MKKVIIFVIWLACYIGALIAFKPAEPKMEESFREPEYVKTENNGIGFEVYKEDSKYFIAAKSAKTDTKYELTKEEYERSVGNILENCDNFIEKYGKGNNHIVVKYPGEEEQEYNTGYVSAISNPCWMLTLMYQIKSHSEDEGFQLNNAIQETFYAYGVEKGNYFRSDDSHSQFCNVLYYGDVLKQIIGDEDCFDKEIMDELIADLLLAKLESEGKLDKSDFDAEYAKKLETIAAASGESVKEYWGSSGLSKLCTMFSIPIVSDSDTEFVSKTVSTDPLMYLNILGMNKDKYLSKEGKEIIIKNRFTYVDSYEKKAYVRTITKDNLSMILFFSEDPEEQAVIIAQHKDDCSEHTKEAFIKDMTRVFLNNGKDVPTKETIVKANQSNSQRNVHIVAWAVFALLGVLLVLGKGKKKEVKEQTE